MQTNYLLKKEWQNTPVHQPLLLSTPNHNIFHPVEDHYQLQYQQQQQQLKSHHVLGDLDKFKNWLKWRTQRQQMMIESGQKRKLCRQTTSTIEFMNSSKSVLQRKVQQIRQFKSLTNKPTGYKIGLLDSSNTNCDIGKPQICQQSLKSIDHYQEYQKQWIDKEQAEQMIKEVYDRLKTQQSEYNTDDTFKKYQEYQRQWKMFSSQCQQKLSKQSLIDNTVNSYYRNCQKQNLETFSWQNSLRTRSDNLTSSNRKQNLDQNQKVFQKQSLEHQNIKIEGNSKLNLEIEYVRRNGNQKFVKIVTESKNRLNRGSAKQKDQKIMTFYPKSDKVFQRNNQFYNIKSEQSQGNISPTIQASKNQNRSLTKQQSIKKKLQFEEIKQYFNLIRN